MRYSLPLVVLATTAGLSLFALPRLEDGPETQIAAAALALDFTVTVPALVLFLLVRARRVPWIAIVPAFVVGYALAVATLPDGHRAVLAAMRPLLVPAELVLVGYLVILARRAVRSMPRGGGDLPTRFRAVARTVLGSRVPADILTTEVAILFYAFRWRRSSPAPRGSFTVHREVGYLPILIGLLLVLLVETVGFHLLVGLWSETARWILTGLSLCAVVWLVGDYRAMTARPVRLTPTHLALRVGLRWEADIPIDQIAQVDPVRSRPHGPNRQALVVALLGQPNLRLRLTRPVEVIGLYGIQKTVGEIWLRVDGAARLRDELRSSLTLAPTPDCDL